MHENHITPISTGKYAPKSNSLPRGTGVSPVRKCEATTESVAPSHTPAPAPSVGELPTSLTFFLRVNERRLILKKLKRFKGDRRTALLRALRIDISDEAFQQEVRRG